MKHPFRRRLRPTLLTLACLGALVDAPAATEPTPSGEATFDVGRVLVSGRLRGPLSSRSLLTSVDVINASVLSGQSTQATWELFDRAPGTMLTNFNQGTTSGKVSFRGFNGEGEVNAVKLLVDGVPGNSNDGNMPWLDAVFPLELAAIELVRGTNDARFGLHNIAGNINLVTRRGGNDTQARAAVGAFNSQDLQLAKALEGGGWTQNYFVGHKRSDGWREHADSKKTTLSGQWFHTRGGWTSGLTLRHFEHDAQEAGYLTLAQQRADPDQSTAFVATDGGRRRVSQVAVHVDGRAGDALDASARVYLNRYFDRRFVKFSAAVSQQERVTDETHMGFRASVSWRPKVSGLHEFALEGGLDMEDQDDRSERYNTTTRVRQATTRNQAWTFSTEGAYVQAVIRPVPSLKLVPALRVDSLTGQFNNLLAGTSAGINDYGSIHQPKISAVYTPVDGLALYGNWGRSFQVGVGAAAYKIPPRVADLKPSINDGWEAGLKFNPSAALEGRVAVWQQKATDEVRRRLNDPSGDSDNIGATRRRGVDLQFSLQPVASLQTWMAYTRQQALIIEPDPAAPATRGKEIDHVPHHVFNAGVDWMPLPAWKLSAWAQGQGDYFLERTNTTGRFGGYRVLNLAATWQIQPTLRLEAQLRNVSDRPLEYVWHDGTQSLHSSGIPRSLSLGLSASW